MLRPFFPALLSFLILTSFSSFCTGGEGPPLVAAHAHNDYEHSRPLLDALDHGFMSVETDVHVVGGALLVAHNRVEVVAGRTLEALYLEPLAARIEENKGRVHAETATGKEPLILLVDIKGAAEERWRLLSPLLEKYRSILTEYTGGKVTRRAVTVVVSGNRPLESLTRMENRLAFVDGRPDDLERNPPVELVPLISADAKKVFRWRGEGGPDAQDQHTLQTMALKAHAQGRRLRFWGTQDHPVVWAFLRDGGVDLLGTDDLAALRNFLLSREAGK